MRKNIIPIVCDSLLSCFITFFTVSVLLRTMLSKMVAVFILSIVAAVLVCLTVFLTLSRKNKHKILKLNDEKRWDFILSELEIMPDNRLIDLFLPIFKDCKIINIEDNFIETENSVYLFDYSKTTERNRAVNLKKNSVGKNAILFCNMPTDDCLTFCKQRKITVFDKNALPELEKEYNLAFPTQTENIEKPRIFERIKNKLTELATFKRAATSALSAAGIILFSRLSFFPKWYIFCGSLLLAFSAILLVIRIAEKKQPSSIKDTLFN